MIYLDYNSTTPTDKRVVDAMIPMFTEHFGNPSSTHASGMDAASWIDDARKNVAVMLGTNPSDIIFTSGATEANNMTILNFMNFDVNTRRILYGATEHKSVIEPCKFMDRMGIDSSQVPVTQNGIIDFDSLKEKLETPTDMVSIALANGETGIINPIKKIAKIVHDAGAILHSDITQAVGKIPVDVYDLGIDIATCSSHKLYGPKGCGALVASREIRKQIMPFIRGGGQENNMRSGTQNVPGIVGFGLACHLACQEMQEESVRLQALRDNFEFKINSAIPDTVINSKNAKRLPNTSNIRIIGALADAVIVNAKDIEMSAGSACSSSTMEPSHVLLAMGLDRTAADESVRISIGRYTQKEDIELAVTEIVKAAEFVRKKESKAMGAMR